MNYRKNETKTYDKNVEDVFKAAQAAVNGLEGKVLNQGDNQLEVQFHKTILGKVLGDRTRFEIEVSQNGAGSQVDVLAFPLDAIGRELKFGARKGVTKTVMGWYWAHLEHHLKKG
ncbi:MAG: hypothetical protein AAF614_33570 [Chloroflexota bacterium]